MTTFPLDARKPFAAKVVVEEDSLTVHLVDGRVLSVPVDWYPRLAAASTTERQNWRLIGRGEGIHWDDVDEDISVDSLLLGKSSTESQRSFQRWLQSRTATG